MSTAETGAPLTFMDLEVQECPYDAYATLLDEQPVYRDPVSGFYVVTRYDDLRRILTDPETFASGGFLERVRDSVAGERAARMTALYEEKGWLPGPTLSMQDEPRHGQSRDVFDKAFRAGRIRDLDPLVERTAYELVEGFMADGECDFVKAFAVPLPLIVIGHQMGVPRSEIWKIKAWTDAWVKRLGLMQTEEEEHWSIEQEIEAQHYFQRIFERLRQEPDGTLLSDLVNTPKPDGRLLSDNELHAHMMADTFVGGSETTTNALSAGIWLLCENPDQYDKLRADPDRYLKIFIEEVLRLESPVQGLYRIATKAVVLQGVEIPEGSVLNIKFAAANRDDRQFGCPAALDLDRRNAGSHLAFGSGVHHCLGAPLARRELYWGFKAVLDRIDDIRLAPGRNDFRHIPSIMLRALKELHIEFSPRRSGPAAGVPRMETGQ
ncbi:MAG: cytochrome P450 [Alphaproteobacteria bacterium]|nr:cytochrome P450 [Alphaproteobacteria bacterium]